SAALATGSANRPTPPLCANRRLVSPWRRCIFDVCAVAAATCRPRDSLFRLAGCARPRLAAQSHCTKLAPLEPTKPVSYLLWCRNARLGVRTVINRAGPNGEPATVTLLNKEVHC